MSAARSILRVRLERERDRLDELSYRFHRAQARALRRLGRDALLRIVVVVVAVLLVYGLVVAIVIALAAILDEPVTPEGGVSLLGAFLGL